MKKLLIGVVILLVAYVGVLFVAKNNAATVFEDEVAKINSTFPVVAVVNEQRSGLLSKSATIDVRDQSSPDVIFHLQQTLSYGPVMFTEEGVKFGWFFLSTDILPSDKLKTELPPEINIDDLFDIYFMSGFSGSVEGDFYFKGFELAMEGNSINIAKAEMHVDTDLGFKQLDASGNWPGMSFNDGRGNFKIDNMEFDSKQTLISGDLLAGTGLYEGYGVYKLGKVEMNKGPEAFLFEDMYMKAATALTGSDKQAMDISMEMKTGKVAVANETFTDATMNLYFKNLDLDTLQQISAVTQKMQAAVMEGLDTSGYNAELSALMMTLVQKGPSIELKDTQVVTTDGPIKAQLAVNVDKDKVDPQMPMAMIAAVDAKLNAEAPEAFFANRGLSPMVQQYEQMNFVVRDNGTLRVEATFQNGQPLVNGKPMQGMPGM